MQERRLLLVRHLHFQNLDSAGLHGWSGRAGVVGHGLFITDEGLRVEFEGFSHELGDAVKMLVS
jgi:hypothetical protein